jgi:E3 ubiquitin-protein ligase TRIP12
MAVQWFTEVLSEMLPQDQKRVLQFVTGMGSLPMGGFASLRPRFTIAKAPSSAMQSCTDMQLPSASPCANYLKLPAYQSKELMEAKLMVAITDGLGSFEAT